MGFKLDLSAAYYAPVKLAILDADGKLQTHLFDAQFERVGEDKLQDMQERIDSRDLDDNALLDRVMVGWRGVTDANDVAIPYTTKSRRDACDKAPGMRKALVVAYFASLEPKAAAYLSQKN